MITYDEFINESKDSWQLASDNSPLMFRFSGKTFPQIMYSKPDKLLYGRDNNGVNVSKSLTSEDISVEGLKDILNQGISKPWPSDSQLQEFISRIK
jgi:hypothetical protein